MIGPSQTTVVAVPSPALGTMPPWHLKRGGTIVAYACGLPSAPGDSDHRPSGPNRLDADIDTAALCLWAVTRIGMARNRHGAILGGRWGCEAAFV